MASIFLLNADKSRLTVVQREPITSGSVNVYKARFSFNSDWNGLDRTAVFKSGSRAISARLDDSGACTIPWEVTGPDSKDKMLFAGCFGTCGGETILPTIWASLGVIAEGAGCCPDASRPPSAPDGEGGGESDHRFLIGRDAEGQHPISSISGLSKELDRIPEPVEPLTNFELEDLLQ